MKAANDRLSQYEKELDAQAHPHQAPIDYGTADYMDEYALSTVPAFTKAAQGDKQRAAGCKDTENETTETKNTPRPTVDGAFKPG